MIAKRIDTKAKTPRLARLVKYVVAAQGGLDPRSWTRTADYVLNSGTSNRGEKVGGVRVSNCHTDDPAAATALIECTQAANTRSKTDKTYHLVFSFPPGEEPDLKTLHAIEDQLCASIGYADHQRISAVHIDCDHLHVHVAINKVHPTGYQNVEPYFDKKKLMEACDRLEREYKLTPTNHGLTGEKKREKHNAIELHPQRRIDANTRKQLHKSHILASASGSKGKDNYGMPELPGSNVAHIERGYSELLPGDARNRLLSKREKHSDGLRWEGNGASRSRTGLDSRTAQAEAHSGVESLTGFIQREVSPAIHKAKDWTQLHATLASHGLEIKKRGAGLVIGSGNLWVRASQCDRAFSLKHLTGRLGEFEQSLHPTRTAYTPKPRQFHPLSAILFDQYQNDRNKYAKIRAYGLEQAKYEGALLEVSLKKWTVAQRLIVKMSAKGPKRRAMLKVITLGAAATRAANWHAVDKKRKEVLAQTAFPSWANWLAQQSEQGSTEALAVLRSRQERETMRGDTLSAAKPASAETIILKGLKLAADAKGSLHYRTADGGLVIDRNSHVQSFRTTAGSSLMTLQIAAERFKGQTLIVEGNQSFQQEIARLAKTQGISVRLSEPTKTIIKTKDKSITQEAGS